MLATPSDRTQLLPRHDGVELLGDGHPVSDQGDVLVPHHARPGAEGDVAGGGLAVREEALVDVPQVRVIGRLRKATPQLLDYYTSFFNATRSTAPHLEHVLEVAEVVRDNSVLVLDHFLHGEGRARVLGQQPEHHGGLVVREDDGVGEASHHRAQLHRDERRAVDAVVDACRAHNPVLPPRDLGASPRKHITKICSCPRVRGGGLTLIMVD